MVKRAMMACLTIFACVIGSRAADEPQPSAADKKFVADATSGNMLKIRLGQYASNNAASKDVKELAEAIVNDLTQEKEELQSIASEKSIESPRALTSEDQAVLDRLEKLSGADFDKDYIAAMIKDHQTHIAKLEAETHDGTCVRVKGFAEKNVPTLKHHLQMAQAIYTSHP